ncbi:hypothetical protein MNBD_GAMMA20-292, partial [hydrothermal vent metagenome]
MSLPIDYLYIPVVRFFHHTNKHRFLYFCIIHKLGRVEAMKKNLIALAVAATIASPL